MRRLVFLPRVHRHGGSSEAPPATAWGPAFCVPVSWASTALVVRGATAGASSCPEAPSASAATATTAVAAAAMRYQRLTRPVTGVPLDRRPVPETAAPSADNGNRAGILSRVRRRCRRRLGVGIVPKLAELFRARYLADGIDFDSIRVHASGIAGVGGDLACRALGARAFTVGTDIYFAAGEFRPDSRDGLWLLAHEVAHVVQQCAGLIRAPRPGTGSALAVMPAGMAEERAADRAADALIAGRSVTFGASAPGVGGEAGTEADRRPVLQRYMAWEHSMLGDLDPALVQAAAEGNARAVADYRDLLAELGRAPRQAEEKRLRAAHPGLDPVRLRGSGLVVTLGELNVLPDYLGRPEDIESAPLSFVGPLIQSVRSWSIAELARPAGVRGSVGPRPASLPRLLPGSLRYPLLGPLAETAEIAAVSALGRRHGFEPDKRYSAVLARNSGHFAPFSWYRWHSFHLAARQLIAQSAAETGAEREALRLRARTWAGYADHFLQDSFAAGHLINKTLVIQWYIEWLAAAGVTYPGRDVLDTLTVARQPLLHGPGHYDRAAARAAGLVGAAAPGPTRDAQDVADAGALEERIAASGVVADSDAERRAAYAAYLAMLGSGTVQLAVKVAHEHLNAHSLVVSAGPAGPRFRLNGDHTLLADPAGALRAAEAAAASRRAITELLRDGETSVDSWDIADRFPDHVEQDGRLVSLPQWHREGLRDLCFELFERRSTRALRRFMSGAFGQRVLPTGDIHIDVY